MLSENCYIFENFNEQRREKWVFWVLIRQKFVGNLNPNITENREQMLQSTQDRPWVHNLHSVQNMKDAFPVWESDKFKKKRAFLRFLWTEYGQIFLHPK